ncbi:MAG: hypothetical protein JWQ35_395 [Bacteriovoracaceae bacterium]|nr:hypothetical protein [Bacteriovoracaceae bacterium]
MAFQAKRKFQRSVQREAVKILSPAGIEYATYEDLSAGGLKLWLDHDMEPQTTLSLEFSLREPGQTPQNIKVVGRAVRCIKTKAGFEVGVQFLNLQEPTREAIQKLFDGNDGPF